jgi:hypothetical protein
MCPSCRRSRLIDGACHFSPRTLCRADDSLRMHSRKICEQLSVLIAKFRTCPEDVVIPFTAG